MAERRAPRHGLVHAVSQNCQTVEAAHLSSTDRRQSPSTAFVQILLFVTAALVLIEAYDRVGQVLRLERRQFGVVEIQFQRGDRIIEVCRL